MNEVFKALADPTRRAILHELNRGSRTAGELSDLFPLAKSTLSGHFNVLKTADLVHTEKDGTTVIYHLNTSVFADVMGYLLEWFGFGDEAGGKVGSPGSEKVGSPDPGATSEQLRSTAKSKSKAGTNAGPKGE